MKDSTLGYVVGYNELAHVGTGMTARTHLLIQTNLKDDGDPRRHPS